MRDRERGPKIKEEEKKSKTGWKDIKKSNLEETQNPQSESFVEADELFSSTLSLPPLPPGNQWSRLERETEQF